MLSCDLQNSAASRVMCVPWPSTNKILVIGKAISFDFTKSNKDFKNATNVAESIHPLLVAAYVASEKPAKPTSRILSQGNNIIGDSNHQTHQTRR